MKIEKYIIAFDETDDAGRTYNKYAIDIPYVVCCYNHLIVDKNNHHIGFNKSHIAGIAELTMDKIGVFAKINTCDNVLGDYFYSKVNEGIKIVPLGSGRVTTSMIEDYKLNYIYLKK